MEFEADYKQNFSQWIQDTINNGNVTRSCSINIHNETKSHILTLDNVAPHTGTYTENDDSYIPVQPPSGSKIFFCQKNNFLTGCSGVLQFKVADGAEECVLVVGYCNQTFKFLKRASNKASVGLYTESEFEKIRQSLYAAIIGSVERRSSAFVLRYCHDVATGKARKGPVQVSVSVSDGDHCNIRVILEDNPHHYPRYMPSLKEGEGSATLPRTMRSDSTTGTGTADGQPPRVKPKPAMRKSQSFNVHRPLPAVSNYTSKVHTLENFALPLYNQADKKHSSTQDGVYEAIARAHSQSEDQEWVTDMDPEGGLETQSSDDTDTRSLQNVRASIGGTHLFKVNARGRAQSESSTPPTVKQKPKKKQPSATTPNPPLPSEPSTSDISAPSINDHADRTPDALELTSSTRGDTETAHSYTDDHTATETMTIDDMDSDDSYPRLQNVRNSIGGISVFEIDAIIPQTDDAQTLMESMPSAPQNIEDFEPTNVKTNQPHSERLLQDLRDLISKYSEASSESEPQDSELVLVEHLLRELKELATMHANTERVEDVVCDLKIIVKKYDS